VGLDDDIQISLRLKDTLEKLQSKAAGYQGVTAAELRSKALRIL